MIKITTEKTPLTVGNLPEPDIVNTSIIIVNYNGRFHLPACLDSLLQQEGEGTEIILVDNASSDGSADLIENNYPQAHLIRSRKNLGFSGANNLAAKQAQGKYLIFLNQDTIVASGCLTALVDALENNEYVGLATAKILLLDHPEQVNAAGNQIHLTGLTLCRGLGDNTDKWNTPDIITAISGAAFIIRSDLFTELGGFDIDYFMYFEDTDISLRARLLGYDCLFVPQAVVYHDYKLHFGSRKVYYEERNRYITLLKVLRWPTLLVLLPTLLLGEIITWGFVLTQDRTNWQNKPKAYYAISQQWLSMIQKRRQVQATRQISDRNLLETMTYRIAFEQTGNGVVAKLAHICFDPLFWLQSQLVRLLVRW